MPDTIDILLRFRADTKGVVDMQHALGQFQAALKGTAPASAGFDKLTIASQRLATEQARTAAATQRLATEEQRTAGATSQAAASAARAEIATLRLAQAKEKASGGGSGLIALPRTIDGITGPAARAAVAITGIGSALALVSKGVELAEIGAQASLVKTRFDGLAQSAGTTGQALITALRAASGGEISDLNLQLAANKAQLLGVAHSAEEFGVLMSIARDRAQQMGLSTTQAFDNLVTGLGRGSALILDNLGIMLSETEAHKAYAASVGKTVSQLTEAEKKQAIINATLVQGRASLAATGGAVTSAAGDFEKLKASSDNAAVAVGTLIAKLLQVPARVTSEILVTVAGGIGQLNDFDTKLKQASEAAYAGAHGYDEYAQRVAFANEQLAPFKANIASLSEPTYEYAQALQASGTSAEEAFNKALQLGTAIDNTAQTQGYLWERTTVSGEAISALGERMVALAGTSDSNRTAVESLSASFNAGGISADELQAAITTLEQRNQAAAAAAAYDAIEQAHLTQAHTAAAAAAAEAATQSLIDAAAKDEQAAKTALLKEQTDAAVTSFLDLHPNISANGVAALAAAGQIDPLIAQLAIARIRAEEARAALAAFNAQAGIRAQAAQDFRAGERSGGAFASAADQKRVTEQRIQTARVEQQISQLHESDAQRLKRLRGEYVAMVPYDERRVATEREIMSLEKGRARAGGGRGGGGARASEAQKTGDKLADIQRNTGQKLAEIDQNTQQKLLDIDAKYAAQRAEQARALANEIITSSDQMRVEQESDDLDLIGAKDEQLAKLQAREAAQAKARIANEQAVAQAKEQAAAGDAKAASDELKIKQDGIARQQALDEKYAEKQAELAGDKKSLATLQTQYNEATAAIQQSTEDRLAIARAEADQRAQAQADEKAKVIADAEEQKAKVVAAAVDQADRVKGATEAQRHAVYESLTAQANAASSWASATEAASSRVISAYEAAARAAANAPGPMVGGGGSAGSGSGGSARAAGGGTFIAGGPMTITVGDGPSPELVTVSPLGRAGTTTAGPGWAKMAGGGMALSAGGAPRTGMADADSIIWAILNGSKNQKAQISALKQYLAIVEQAATIINTIAQIRATLHAPQPLLRVEDMERIARDAAMVTTILADNIVPATRLQANQLKGYTEMIKISVEALRDVTELRKNMAEPQSPLTEEIIRKLATEVQMVTRILMEMLIPTGRQAHDALEYYADVSSKGVSILKGMIDLRSSIKDLKGPLDERQIRALAAEAQRVARIVMSALVPLSEQLAKEMGEYAASVGHSVGIIKDVADLRSSAKEMGPPIAETDIRRIAAEAIRITRIMRSMLLPTTEAQSKAASEYADAVGKSIAVLKDTLDLPGRLFSDYTSPTDAQIRRVVADANRITRQIAAAAKTYDTKGLEAAKAYTEALSGTFAAIKDGLLAVQALNSGDFEIKAGALERFGRSAALSLTEVRRLAAQAAAIPPSNLSALERATAALTAFSEALIKATAAPPLPPNFFGPGLAPLANGGGRVGNPFAAGAPQAAPQYGNRGPVPLVVNVYNPPANLNVPALVGQVKAALRQDVGGHR